MPPDRARPGLPPAGLPLADRPLGDHELPRRDPGGGYPRRDARGGYDLRRDPGGDYDLRRDAGGGYDPRRDAGGGYDPRTLRPDQRPDFGASPRRSASEGFAPAAGPAHTEAGYGLPQRPGPPPRPAMPPAGGLPPEPPLPPERLLPGIQAGYAPGSLGSGWASAADDRQPGYERAGHPGAGYAGARSATPAEAGPISAESHRPGGAADGWRADRDRIVLDRAVEPTALASWRPDGGESVLDRPRDLRSPLPGDSQWPGSPVSERPGSAEDGRVILPGSGQPARDGLSSRPRDLSALLGRRHGNGQPGGDIARPGSGGWFAPGANDRQAEAAHQGVPGPQPGAAPIEPAGSSRDDDTLTRPLPVVLPGATSVPRPGPVEAPRGFFEPARRDSEPPSVTGAVEPPSAAYVRPPERPMPKAAEAKLEQLKDLYLTAEAIGERALDKHFDQVSERQRELIREFFERSEPDSGGHQR